MREYTESITEVSARILVHGQPELQHQRITPVRSFAAIATIIILLCIGSLVSTLCHAASNPQQVRIGEKTQPANQIVVPSTSLKTIIVGDYYPYTFVNDKGVPDGFSVDVAQAVTHVMDLKLEIRVDTWQHATEALSNGNIDLLPMMAYSPERDKIFDFSAPHTIAYDAVFSRVGTQKISSRKDLGGKTVIVMNKDAAHQYLLSSGMAAKIKLILVDSLPDALRTLAEGKGDVALMPKLVGLIIMKNLNLANLDPSPVVVDAYNRPFSFAVRNGNQALLERLSQGLGIIKSTGQYHEIYNKWFGTIEPKGLPWGTVIKYIEVIVAVFILAALGLVLWNVSLRKQVSLRTNNLAAEIEERKLAEEELRRSEDNFRRSLDESPLGVRIVSEEGTTIYANRAILDIYGYESIDELKITPPLRRYSPESYADFQMRREIRKRGDYVPPDYEISIIRKDGEIRHLQVSRKEILWDNERQFQVIYQDITERKLMEKALETRLVALTRPLDDSAGITFEELFNLKDIQRLQDEFARATGVASIITNPDGTPITAPSNFCRLCSDVIRKTEKGLANCFKSDAAIGRFCLQGPIIQLCMSGGLWDAGAGISVGGRHIANWLIGQVRDTTQTEDKMRDYAREIGVDETLMVTAFREVPAMPRIQFDQVAQALFTLANQLSAIAYQNVQQARFIAESKHAEKSIRDSEEKFSRAFQKAPLLMTISSIDDGTYLDVNEEFSAVSGYSREEAIGKTSVELGWVKPEDRENLIGELKSKGFVEAMKLELTARGGRNVSCLYYGEVITIGERPTLLSIAQDITEHKRTEEENRNLQDRLQRAEKMEALGQLAGGVAHDLNNVLGILTGYSELLLGEIPEDGQSRIYINKILQSTGKGAAIIQDLLTLARRGVTVSEVVNLNSIVTDYLQTPVFEKIKDNHPQITFNTEPDNDLLNIKGSPVHLEKTLMNLVSNAAEAISGEGEVTIRTESRYLDKPLHAYDEIKEGDYAILTISDTGMGISAEDREKIFEPFYTRKKMGRSGTGLGLAIVWGTVKDHNGYIDVQTEVGKGTTFTLYFPVTQDEMIAQQEKIPIEQYMGKGESVLVVDDVEEQREIASRLLAKLGYAVSLASSGEKAVEYLKSNKADILVLDMIMVPGIDGLGTYKRVLEINPKQKAIIVSGFSETDRTDEAQKLGAGAYVKKPYVLEKIGVAIRDELDR